MNSELLHYYNRELGYLRELGAEFAQSYPKVAARLSLQGTQVADPYVERLLEGLSFLTARIQMKMDAEFPRLSQQLLDVIQPSYLMPVPSMAILQFEPSMNEGSLAQGFVLPRHTALRSKVPSGEQTACEFSTCHPVQIWPLELTQVSLESPVTLPLQHLGSEKAQRVKSVLRLSLKVRGGCVLEDLALDRLSLYLGGPAANSSILLCTLMQHVQGVFMQAEQAAAEYAVPQLALEHDGLLDEHAALPEQERSFSGHRLLQEYFALPGRFNFVSVAGLAPTIARWRNQGSQSKQWHLHIALSHSLTELTHTLRTEHVRLHCTPAINLFRRRSERMAIHALSRDHHVVMDRTRPLDFEVCAVEQVVGYGVHGKAEHVFSPLYATVAQDQSNRSAYYTVRREPRVQSDTQKHWGTRSSYGGSEVFLSLVDQHERMRAQQLTQLSVTALCSNRDLPLLMPTGQESDFSLRVSAPVKAIKLLQGPTRPRPMLAAGQAAWGLVGQVGLGQLGMAHLDPLQAAGKWRAMLELYVDAGDVAARRQIASIISIHSRPEHRRIDRPGPIVYGRGVHLTVILDIRGFPDAQPYVFGAVLSRYLARHVSINSFISTEFLTEAGALIGSWCSLRGTRPEL